MAMLEIDWNPGRRALRVFGGALVAVLVAAGVWVHWGAWIGAGAAAVLAVAAPAALRPVYLALNVITYPIGWVTSLLVLAILYYLVVTPVGLVMRLTGRDVLGRSRDPSAPSYWVARKPPGPLARYFRSF